MTEKPASYYPYGENAERKAEEMLQNLDKAIQSCEAIVRDLKQQRERLKEQIMRVIAQEK